MHVPLTLSPFTQLLTFAMIDISYGMERMHCEGDVDNSVWIDSDRFRRHPVNSSRAVYSKQLSNGIKKHNCICHIQCPISCLPGK